MKAAFFPGAADTPVYPGDTWSAAPLRSKREAGARFVQTQFCFDMDLLAHYIGRLREEGLTEDMYFLVGLGPLRSADGARWYVLLRPCCPVRSYATSTPGHASW